jgi:hypothetical protein
VIEAIRADVLDDSAVANAIAKADAVVNRGGALTETTRQTYRALHVESARRIALAATRQGVARLIDISALGASPDSPAESDRTKAEGELAVRAAFPEATIVRLSLVFGEDDHFFNGFAAMAKRTPVLPLIGGGSPSKPAQYFVLSAAGLPRALIRPICESRRRCSRNCAVAEPSYCRHRAAGGHPFSGSLLCSAQQNSGLPTAARPGTAVGFNPPDATHQYYHHSPVVLFGIASVMSANVQPPGGLTTFTTSIDISDVGPRTGV